MSRKRAVTKVASINRFLAAAMQRRVAVCTIADSNSEQLSSTGHNDGMARALTGLFGRFATPVIGAGMGAGGYTAECDGIASSVRNGMTGAPQAFIDAAFPSASGTHPGTGDWIAGWAGNSGSGLGYRVLARNGLDLIGALRWRARIYLPPSTPMTELHMNIWVGGGVGSVVYPASPSAGVLALPSTSGLHDIRWDVPAGDLVNLSSPSNPIGDGRGWNFREQRWTDTDLSGNIGILFRCIEDPTQTRGIQFGRLFAEGGVGTKKAATDICNVYPDAALIEWMRQQAILQVDAAGSPLPPMLLVHLLHGGNDAGDTASSVTYARGAGFGNAVTTGNALSNTQTGVELNTQAIINRLRDVWVAAGYSESNLFFVLGPYHPQNTGTTQYTFTRLTAIAAWKAVAAANNNCCCLDGYQIRTHEEFSYQHGYKGITNPSADEVQAWDRDGAHLTQMAYWQWGMDVWGAIMDAAFDNGLAAEIGGRRGRLFVPMR